MRKSDFWWNFDESAVLEQSFVSLSLECSFGTPLIMFGLDNSCSISLESFGLDMILIDRWIVWYGRKWWCKTWAFSRLMMNSTKGANSNGNAVDDWGPVVGRWIHEWFDFSTLLALCKFLQFRNEFGGGCGLGMVAEYLRVVVQRGLVARSTVICGFRCGVPMRESR